MLKTTKDNSNINNNQTNLICLPCEYSGSQDNYVKNSSLKKFEKGLGWIQEYAKKYLNK